MRTFASTCAAVALVVASAPAQSPRAFPADVALFDRTAPEVVLAPRIGDFATLAQSGALRMTDLLLPSGETVDLDVRPLDLSRNRFDLTIDGMERPELLAELDLSTWTGTVHGDPSSEVFLSFSTHGSRGWIQKDGVLWHLLAAPAEGDDWTASTIRIVAEQQLLEDGRVLGEYCAAERLKDQREPKAPTGTAPVPSGAVDPCSLKECPVALECDWQLYQVFNDVAAETAYVTTLLSWVSCRYEEQADTILTFPYLVVHTDANDGWTQQDNGGDCIDVLNELQSAWAFDIPQGASIGHLLSGANLGCGVAWLDVLCDDEFGFSVSGNLDGGVQFPIQQQSGNWDFMVIAHELGHNFGAPHTHDLGIDDCAGGSCISNGTIMSYCHTCTGGTANITTYFYDPTITDLLKTGAQSCLADHDASPTTYCTALITSNGCVPSIGYTGQATLGGPDDFHATANDVIGVKPGLFFASVNGPAALPFFGGTLCMQPPLYRTPPQLSSGMAGACGGTYDYNFTQAEMSFLGLSAGDTMHGQYWFRDSDAAQGTGLSDALEVTMCN